jgi:hypothetical protein
LGQGVLTAIVTKDRPRIEMSLDAEGMAASGRFGTDSTLFLRLDEASRDEMGVRLLRPTRLDWDWGFDNASGVRWGADVSPAPDGAPDPRGLALLLGADLRVTSSRRLTGVITVIPRVFLNQGGSEIRPQDTLTIDLDGEVGVRCRDERRHVTYTVGTEHPGCAALFADFEGLAPAD